jgi:hypothetical protein
MMMERAYQTHMFTYRHDGAEWTLMLKATDADDARARIGKLAYANYDGIVDSQMPAAFAPIGIVSVWAKNLAQRMLKRFRRAA